MGMTISVGDAATLSNNKVKGKKRKRKLVKTIKGKKK